MDKTVIETIAQQFKDAVQKHASLPEEQTALAHKIMLAAGFAALTKTAFPTSPPNGETYKRKNKSETAPDFIQRVYGEWLTGEFTRADLRKIDAKAIIGLKNWEKNNGRRTDINLPTLPEYNTKKLENMSQKPRTERAALQRLRSNRVRLAAKKGPENA